jgi:hypothetical protein
MSSVVKGGYKMSITTGKKGLMGEKRAPGWTGADYTRAVRGFPGLWYEPETDDKD